MTKDSTIRRLERELERERASLAETLEELNGRLSADQLAQEALGFARSTSSAAARSLTQGMQGMQNNPLALAVAGAGLAWALAGRGKVPGAHVSGRDALKSAALSAVASTASDILAHPEAWEARLAGLRNTARDALDRIDAAARSGASEARDYAAERAKVLSAFTDEMRTTLADGLEGLSDSAREKVVAAREAAYAASLRADQKLRAGGRDVVRLIEEHPVAAGGIALALGAAVSLAISRSRAAQDAADSPARATVEALRRERDRLSRMAADLADELKQSAVATTAASKIADTSKRFTEGVDKSA